MLLKISNFNYVSLQRGKSLRKKQKLPSILMFWMAEDSFSGQLWILHWLKPAEELHPCFSVIWDRWLFKNHAFVLHMPVSKLHLQYNKSITDEQVWSRDVGFCAVSCLPQFLDTYVNLISDFLLFILKYYYHSQGLQQPIYVFF